MASKLPPVIRAQRFQSATREHIQNLPAQPFVPGNGISFEIPKSRYLSKIGLLISGTVNVAHASQTSFTPKAYAPYNLIRFARVEVNNGFAPFRLSGEDLYLYNKTLKDTKAFNRVTSADKRGLCLLETVASVGGTNNDVRFYVELPLVPNMRDAIGLINIQNPTTIVSVGLDFNELTALFESATGYTVSGNLLVQPIVQTFTIPQDEDNQPDLSILKLVNSYEFAVESAGIKTAKLPTGNTYRKMIIKAVDVNGVGLKDNQIGDFLIRLNQSDIPYRINPHILQAENQLIYGDVLEDGVFVLDFASSQGLKNLAGSRDYIDTERLTEFWLETDFKVAGKLVVVAETLARLV